MGPDSVILIDEKVIGDNDQSAQGYTSALSLTMYSLLHGLERKRRQWLKLLKEANFTVKDVRLYTSFADGIITAIPNM
jgi:hypothetical protein